MQRKANPRVMMFANVATIAALLAYIAYGLARNDLILPTQKFGERHGHVFFIHFHDGLMHALVAGLLVLIVAQVGWLIGASGGAKRRSLTRAAAILGMAGLIVVLGIWTYGTYYPV